MKKNITYKAPQGKMLRIKADIKDPVIRDITITGDFFVHPEEDLLKMEEALKGIKIEEIKEVMDRFITENNTEIVGFTPEDLQEALKNKDR